MGSGLLFVFVNFHPWWKAIIIKGFMLCNLAKLSSVRSAECSPFSPQISEVTQVIKMSDDRQ